MHSVTSTPVTFAVVAAMTVLLYGCMAYDAASAVVSVGSTVVSTTGDIVTAPFDDTDSKDK
jgi:hypothetical protein